MRQSVIIRPWFGERAHFWPSHWSERSSSRSASDFLPNAPPPGWARDCFRSVYITYSRILSEKKKNKKKKHTKNQKKKKQTQNNTKTKQTPTKPNHTHTNTLSPTLLHPFFSF